jgi:hypothetical protein
MKQTALEFYAEQEVKLTLDFLANKINQVEYGIKRVKLLQQAKEMEKDNVCDAWDDGYDKGMRDRIEKISNPVGNAEQYYNKTFKSK